MSSFSRRGSNKSRVILAPEALEDRDVPAGNVSAFVSGGTLMVKGDAGDNRVWVMSLGDGNALVAPIDNTTINGARGPQVFSGIAFAINAQMGDGHDFLYVSNTSGATSIFVNMGNGNDGLAVDLAKNTAQNYLAMGAGDDVITMGMGQLKGFTTFDMGPGKNRVNIAATEFGGVAFRGAGTDSLGLLAVNFQSVPILSGFNRVYSTMTPTANHDRATAQSSGSTTINVAANDTAPGNTIDRTSIKITQQPAHGTVTVNGNGTVTFTGDGSAATFDSFKYTIRNSSGAESNEATVSLIFHVTPDTTGPVPTITNTGGSTTNLASIPFTITFNEDVTGFDQSDIAITNGTISGFTAVNARTFTFNVAPTADGAVTVSVAAGAAQDAKGNASTAATRTVTSDRTAPTVTITTPTNPTNATSIPVTVTFSENVTGFDAGDLVVANGSVSGFTAVNGSTYTFNITPTGTGQVQITVNVAAGVATDAAGNSNTAATELIITSDQSAPSVTITTTASNPTSLAVIPFTVQFSKTVTGFEQGDVTITGGTISNFVAVDGDTYTFDVTPTADGTITVSVAAGVATDSAGNENTAATPVSLVSDRTAPTAVVTSTVTGSTATSPIPYTVTFSEDVNGFTAGDILVTNGGVTNFVAVNETTYTFNVVPNAAGDVIVSVPAGAAQDAATNANTASNSLTISFTGTVVTATITTTATDPTNLDTIPFTVTFSDTVTGFELSDLSIINGTASNFVAVNETTYTFDVTPTADGPVTVDVPAGAATAASGPTSAASFVITSDRTGPAPTITTTAANPTNLATIPFTVTFNEDATGFDESDLVVGNGTVSNFVAVNATTYTFDVTPTADGAVTVDIAAGAATDDLGNDSTAATFSITSDRSAPTATVATSASNPTSTSPIPVTITFSEDVTDFEQSDVTVTGGTISNFVAVNDTTYTFDVTPSAAGDIEVSVAADAAQDTAANGNTASNTLTVTFNGTIVTTTITSTATDPNNLAAIPVTVTFGEDVTGFDDTDLSFTNGSLEAGSFVSVDGHTFTFNLVPTADGMVTVTIAAGAATTASGTTAAASFSITSDRTAPTATVTTTDDPTSASPILFTVAFSEDVTGLIAGNMSAANGTIGSIVSVDAHTFTVEVTPTADGPVTLTVTSGQVTDLVGNATAADYSGNTTSDRTAPTVAVNSTSPTAGVITGTSSDSSGATGVAGVRISIFDGTNYWNGTAFASASEVLFDATSTDDYATWTFAFTTPGTYTVRAVATDTAGNPGESTNNAVVVT